MSSYDRQIANQLHLAIGIKKRGQASKETFLSQQSVSLQYKNYYLRWTISTKGINIFVLARQFSVFEENNKAI